MTSIENHEPPAQSIENGTRTTRRLAFPVKSLWILAVVAVVVSGAYLSPSGPLVDNRDLGVATLHIFLATLFLCFALLKASGPHIVAHHGGVGLLAGLLTAGIFFLGAKGGPVLILFGAFPGAAFGLVIGGVRRLVGGGGVAERGGGEDGATDHGLN